MTPAVSVVLPAWNAASYVAEAVAGIAAQDVPGIEIVAVDDGSTDGTAEALEDALAAFEAGGERRRAVLLRQENQGAGAARNAGMARAAGEVLCFHDADDVLMPGTLRALIGALEDRPELEIAFPRCVHVGPDGVSLGIEAPFAAPVGAAGLIAANPIHSDTGVTLRRASAARAGRFDASLPASICIDFWVRVAAGRGRCVAMIDTPPMRWRRHDAQITADWRRQRAGWRSVADRAEAAGILGPDERRRAEAMAGIDWATTAYRTGRHAEARSLAIEAVRVAPGAVLGDAHGRIRLAACAATLLPAALQERLRPRRAPGN